MTQKTWLLAVLGPLLLLSLASQVGTAAEPLRSAVLAVVALAAAWGAVRNQPTIPAVGWLIVVAVAANALNVVAGLESVWLVLLGFVAGLGAIATVQHTRRQGFGIDAAVDATVATAAPFAVVLAIAGHAPLPADAPVLLAGNFTVLLLVVVAVSQPYVVPAALLIGLGAIAMSTVVDLAGLIRSPLTDGGTQLLGDLPLLLLAASTLHPTFADVTSSDRLPDQRHRVVRLLLLASSLGVTLLLIAVDAGLLVERGVLVGMAPAWLLVLLITWRILRWIRMLGAAAAAEREVAETDPLTGLRSTQGLRAVVREQRDVTPSVGWSLVALDLDRFRLVNDAFGTTGGDVALQAVGSTLRRLAPPDVTLARLNADEFAFLLPGQDRLRAHRLALAAIAAVREQVHAGPTLGRLSLRASAGVAMDDGDDDAVVDRLTRDALTAVGHAQRRSRRPVAEFDPLMAEQASADIVLLRELQRALSQGAEEIQPAFQPIVELSTGRTVAVEALARWTRPDGSTVPTERFLHLAEASGWIVQLGRRMLQRSCEEAVVLRRADPDLRLHVNVSPVEAAQPGFAHATATIIQHTGMPLDAVVLEVTEQVLVPDAGEALSAFVALADLGVGLSLDDFGSGYASVGYLSRLPLDTIKVDKSFTAELGTPGSLMEDLLPFLAARGATVVAEGVETAAQLDRLRALGCPLAQGYLLGRPVPAGDLDLHPASRH